MERVMSDMKYVVIEQYPDETVWKHYFPSSPSAQWAMYQMALAHPARRYSLHRDTP